MLHVFYVHSQTCYVAALKIIEFKKLDRSKIVILNARSTPKIDSRLRHIYIKPLLDNWKFYALRDIPDFKWLHTRRVIRLYDSIIDEILNEKFIFYSQNGRHYKYNIFISSSLCIGNNYFEDGLDNYSTQQEFNIKYPSPLKYRYVLINFVLGCLQGVRLRVRQDRNTFWKGKNKTVFYALHPLSMSKIHLNIPKVILSDISVNVDLPVLSNLPIILPSALEEQKISENKANIQVYIDYLRLHEMDSVHIKWHPAQNEFTKAMYRKSFAKCSITLNEIDSRIPMELYFTKRDISHTILSIGSSLLLYAALFNKNITSIVLYNNLHKILDKKTARSKFWQESFSLFNLENLKIIVSEDFELNEKY